MGALVSQEDYSLAIGSNKIMICVRIPNISTEFSVAFITVCSEYTDITIKPQLLFPNP
jgi:hypothetical protein